MSSKRHRILYIELPGVVGGTVTGLYELVRHLDHDYYEPVVLFHQPNHPYCERFEALGVKVLTLAHKNYDLPHSTKGYLSRITRDHERLARGYWATSVVAQVTRLLKQEAIDLVHHNDNLPKDRYTVLAAYLANVPQICHIRTLKSLSAFDRYLAHSVDAFIYMSEAIKQVYLDAGIPAQKGQVVYDGFDITKFEKIESSQIAQIRSEFGLEEQDLLISNIGRLDNWKGQDDFLEAIAKVVKICPNVKALLVGASDLTPWNQTYYKKLKQMVKDLDLSSHVIFTGYRTDISQIMVASDLIVHSSSKPEPFGRVIVEGMLAARPVIATAAGGVLDIIEDQVTGILVPPHNVEAMTRDILQLLHNREQAEMMGRKACISAKKKFSVKQHITSINQIYQQVLTS